MVLKSLYLSTERNRGTFIKRFSFIRYELHTITTCTSGYKAKFLLIETKFLPTIHCIFERYEINKIKKSLNNSYISVICKRLDPII